VVFGALGDSTRRGLLRALVDDGPSTATRLAEGRGISRQAVAKHLGVLGEADLVRSERVGREVQFRAHTDALAPAADWIARTDQAWERRLGRLGELLQGATSQDRGSGPAV
jgi:DNA-binding transcriptional ArsR family regulator